MGPFGSTQRERGCLRVEGSAKDIFPSLHRLEGLNGHFQIYQARGQSLVAINIDNEDDADMDIRMWRVYLALWEIKIFSTFRASSRSQFDGRDNRLERGNDEEIRPGDGSTGHNGELSL